LWRKGQVLYALKKNEVNERRQHPCWPCSALTTAYPQDALKAWQAASDSSDTDTDIELLINIKKCLDAGAPVDSLVEEEVPAVRPLLAPNRIPSQHAGRHAHLIVPPSQLPLVTGSLYT
jgi:hypothetical protein